MLGLNWGGYLRVYGNYYNVGGNYLELYGITGSVTNSNKFNYLGGKYSEIRNSSLITYDNLPEITEIYGIV